MPALQTGHDHAGDELLRYEQPTAMKRYAATLPPAAARAFSLFLGGFTLLNLLAEWRNPGLNLNLWWVDLRPLPGWVAGPLLAVAGVCLMGYGLGKGGRRFRVVALVTTLALALAAALNARQYYQLRDSGAIHAASAVPFSLLLVGAFTSVWAAMAAGGTEAPSRPSKALLTAVFLFSLVAFPVAQIYCFGTTDYRRPADAIVVFGAKAFVDNTCSAALADRVRTACALYKEGLAPRLIFSGGPAGGGAHETEAMRRYAIRLGVPDSAILVDKKGLSTHDTVQNTTPMFRQLGMRRVMVVSHFFHLPRIKLSYQRAAWDVFTVPVQNARLPRRQYPFMMFREAVAFWVYYLRGG